MYQKDLEILCKKFKIKKMVEVCRVELQSKKASKKLIYMFSKSENFALAGSLSKTSYKS